jgi:selenocysteine lyase/cysteine desulfurase
MEAIREYETGLALALLDEVSTIRGVTIYGIKDKKEVQKRVPTLCFNLAGVPPAEVAAKLAARDIAVRDGNMYSPRLMTRLGIGESGAVRASLVHYNTQEEVRRLVDELEQIAYFSSRDVTHSA